MYGILYNDHPPFLNVSHLFCGSHDCSDDSPLWDDPPWFYRQLPELTFDDIEMRVCRDQPHNDEDIAIQAFEIYVQ